jgi:hypothetical protein
MQLGDLTPREFYRFFGCHYDKLWRGKAIRNGLVTVAVGGIAEDDGRWWAFADFLPGAPRKAIYKACARGLRDLVNEGWSEVYAKQGPYDTAPRFLRHLGFEPTEEFSNDMRVWVWRR